MASWYGRGFHGRRTANGEIYDMYQATAAHLTAPLGTYAVVTSLSTGRSVRVRINDRGPHVRRRILDLSYGAARELDMVRAGSARVKVEFFGKQAPPVWTARAAVFPTAEEAAGTEAMEVTEPREDRPHTMPVLPAVAGQPFVVQAGAYHEPSNAARTQHALRALHPQVSISVAPEPAQSLHRVRLGPFPNRDAAERMVQQVRARGYVATVVAMAP